MSVLRLLTAALAVLALTLAAALAQATDASAAYDKGLVWRIERKGVAPSFLFGTLHDDDERITRLAPQVQRALDRSKRFAVELIDEQEAVARFRRAMVRKEPRLDTLLGEADWPRYDERLAAHGMPRDARAHLKPWAALLILVRPAESPGIVLDKLLLLEAGNRGKDIVALETIDEQIAAMNDLPEESQLALLRHAEANYERIQQSFAALRDAYLARDLAAIWKLNRDMMAGGNEIEPHNARFLDSLLFRRNQRFAERLVPLLDQGGTFAAFGALHLYGTRGVPALLAARGYKVTRIY
jgi:uncharacterized protein YbaP (TraB family)